MLWPSLILKTVCHYIIEVRLITYLIETWINFHHLSASYVLSQFVYVTMTSFLPEESQEASVKLTEEKLISETGVSKVESAPSGEEA